MTVYLRGLCLQFYRGIGQEIQYAAPFSDLNFFIGANNAGKSTVLNFIHEWLPTITDSNYLRSLESTEMYRGSTTGNFSSAVGIPIDDFYKQITINLLGQTNIEGLVKVADFRKLFKYISHDNFIWVFKENGILKYYNLPDTRQLFDQMPEQNWKTIWSSLFNQSTRYFGHRNCLEIVNTLLQFQNIDVPSTVLIPAKRELGPTGEDFADQTGKGLIDKIAELQSPSHDQQLLRSDFNQINRFLRDVSGKSDAKIEVPHNREHLLVHIDDKVLPLYALGTGIHEVILIAAFCTIHKEKIVCIEEPEIHLHPVLQRKLVRYLRTMTDNQYFIATHSAAFIDTPGASIFRVVNDGVQTRIDSAALRNEQKAICDDLGSRASDILQANSIVWVEGPSDRIYLAYWIREFDPELIEGIHYTIMFYGGSLISHLSADDDVLEEFIDLKSLNQNMAIVLDSDKGKPQTQLKPAVKRIKRELGTGSSVVWITKGREVENYIDANDLHGAIKKVHSTSYKEPDKTGPYDHSFYFKVKKPKSGLEGVYKATNKVAVAKEVCKKSVNLNLLDLNDRLKELTEMIRRANGLLE